MNTVKENTLTVTTVELGALLEVLEGAATHAHKKTDLQVLNTVKLESAGDRFTAVATDRYRLIEGSIAGEGEQLPASLVSLEDIKRVISLLKGEGKRADKLPVSVSRVGDMLSVSVRGNAITLELVAGTFPPVEQYLSPAGKPVASERIVFNPAYMADYSKIASRGSKSPVPVLVESYGDRKPMKIIFGEGAGKAVEWRAVLMPMTWKD